jgi:hypothetical protein
MTFAEIADHYAPRSEEIIGPYSRWPRRRKRARGSAATLAAVVVGAGLFVHCAGGAFF